MNLSTDQLIFLAGIIKEMTAKAQTEPEARVEGKFAIKLEWQPGGQGTAHGQYILRGVQEENVTRG